MKIQFKIINIFFITFLMSNCASKLVVQSDPPQADVYISIEGKADKIKAGQTPIELSEVQINELLKTSPENTEWLHISVELKDHEKRFFLIPSNRWGETSRALRVQLKPMDDNETVVTKILKYFFNAKKFAETKQFEQAIGEIDKVLALNSKMPQALSMKAGIYFMQGNMNEARALYKQALEIDPGFNDAIQMLERIQNKSEASR